MNTHVEDELSTLSAEAVKELSTAHELGDLFDDPTWSSDEPAASIAKSTELGEKIMAVARWFERHPLVEDAGTNQDKASLIRRCFVEGVPLKGSLWDEWIALHPSSPV